MVEHRAVPPLGIFDSGLGGLTVVRAISRSFPGLPLVYFGDTARLPYGNKSGTTVTRLSLEALRFLQHFHPRGVVVACNSASAVAIPSLEQESPVPVWGVVEAGARRAAERTRGGVIGVLGTHGTVASGCYERALHALRPDLNVIAAACPLFVPLVEEGWIDHPVTRTVATEYLEPLLRENVDTVILGCTHYPLLRSVLAEILGPEVELIDSGDAMAEELKDHLESSFTSTADVTHRYFVSDQPERFHREGARFLGRDSLGKVETVDQSDVPWYDRLSLPTNRPPKEKHETS